ncbi:MAG: aldo/keto reductase, partial [Bacteroidales bacterium]|nr:aldo/keto reductase [Bacteroidales bacterium]
MNKTIFGKTGKNVTLLGMGGMRFEKEIPEKECIASIRYANELGINYFDTAPIYNEDRSEDIYGKAFNEMPRDQFLVATKGENEKSAKEIEKSIERSLKRLKVDQIDFYFLWCVIHPHQFEKAKMKGRSLEAIIKAKKKGLISHVGVSTHMYSEDIIKIVDSGLFEFIMIPYNALNFRAREEGLRYAKKHNLGTIVMNPLYGGVIPSFRDMVRIYSDSNNSPVEDALRFCLESPFIDVTLSGMNSREIVKENIKIAGRARKKSVKEQNRTAE